MNNNTLKLEFPLKKLTDFYKLQLILSMIK